MSPGPATDPILEFVSRSHILIPVLFLAAVGVLHCLGWLGDSLADLAIHLMRCYARVRDEYRHLFAAKGALDRRV